MEQTQGLLSHLKACFERTFVHRDLVQCNFCKMKHSNFHQLASYLVNGCEMSMRITKSLPLNHIDALLHCIGVAMVNRANLPSDIVMRKLRKLIQEALANHDCNVLNLSTENIHIDMAMFLSRRMKYVPNHHNN